MRSRKTLGNLILLFTAFIWGMAFSFQRRAGAVLGPFTIGAVRMTLAAAEVGLLCLILDAKAGKARKTADPVCRKNTMLGGIVCGVFLGVASTLQQKGMEFTSAGKAGFITALYILFVPVLSALIFRRKITPRVWLAVLIAVGGMYLLTLSSAEGVGPGDLYVLGCAVFFSLQILAADRFAPKADPVKMAEVQFLLVAALCWAAALLFEKPDLSRILSVTGPLLYCGCVSGGMGYTLQMIGQKYADPTPASLCMSFESVFSALGGALILHEMMTGREILGCVIMFVAVILVQLPEKTSR